MAENILLTLFWGWPVLLGLFVWLTKATYAVQYIDRLEAWLAATRTRFKSAHGKVARFWGRPTVIVALSPFSVTAPIKDPFLRCGARAALFPYVAGVLFISTIVALELAVALSCIFLMLAVWGFVSNFGKRGEDHEAPRLPLSRVRGARLYKTGLLADTPTGTRIDENGRVMQEGLLFDRPTGVRVNEDGRILKEGILGDVPSGYKINDEGQLVKEGFLTDTPTGTKVTDDGRVVEEGFFGDTGTGYEYKKE